MTVYEAEVYARYAHRVVRGREWPDDPTGRGKYPAPRAFFAAGIGGRRHYYKAKDRATREAARRLAERDLRGVA